MPTFQSPPSGSGALGVESLAAEWNVSKRTIYRWIRAAPESGVTVALPCRKVGRRIFFIASEVLEWLRLYGPGGTSRTEDAAGGDPVVPSARIKRARRRA